MSASRRSSSLLTLSLCLLLAAPAPLQAKDDETFDEKQARLDAECEAARERKLAPERKALVEECIEKGYREDRAACERFYADHGNQAGNRAALYYDLPECVAAFEHSRSKN
jgi:hypothetical protein